MGMNLEIRHLKLIAAIAETGSMTRAGNYLHLTQSALSHQLRTAEEQLGVPLFERKSRTMKLTPAGERLLQSARAVIAELDGAQKEIQARGAARRELIRLSTECYTVYHWLPERLKLFQQKFPSVEFRLVIEATDNPFQALLEGQLDLAIACTPVRNRKIRYTKLFEDEMLVVTAPDHPLARKKCVELQDFSGETVIVYPPKEESTLLTKILAPVGVWPQKIQEVMLTEAIVEMVKGGLGVAWLARWAVAPQLEAGTVVGKPLTPGGFHRTWSAAQLRDHRAPAYLQEFIQVLAKNPLSACSLVRRKSAA
jgi:LysR family transcriptional regulator, regulator for metE and metH